MFKTKTTTIIFSVLLLALGFVGLNKTVVHAAPPGINISCAPDDLSADKSQICDNSQWVACSVNGTKSSDGKYVCQNAVWSLVTVTPPPPCTEGVTSNSNTLLCQGGVQISCSSAKEGVTSADGTLVCKSGSWTAVSSGSGNVGTQNPSAPTIKFSKVTAVPAGFNPTIESTKISYTLNKDATVNLIIMDDKGTTVATLVANQKMKAGSYFTSWNGTKDNTIGSTVLAAGTYTFKISAKNPTTGTLEDTSQSDINLVYSNGGGAVTQTDAEKAAAAKAAADAQAAATLALQNSKSGKTAKTGPDIFIYSFFPVVGYFISRKSRK